MRQNTQSVSLANSIARLDGMPWPADTFCPETGALVLCGLGGLWPWPCSSRSLRNLFQEPLPRP